MSESQTCLIVGASHGGVACAYALRQEGWAGRIVLIDRDPELPYHRPPLSKGYLNGGGAPADYLLRSADSYAQQRIELRLGEGVANVDPEQRRLRLDSGEELDYDQLVLATGARPFLPPLPGLADCPVAVPLRTLADVGSLRDALGGEATGKRAVVIGGGYIGLEVAASLRKLGVAVTVLEREGRLLARVTAPEMSAYFADLHARHGVDLRTGAEVTAISRDDGDWTVHCADGTAHPADLIVVGVGIRLNTELATAAGLDVDDGIVVDGACRTSDPHIYAIGDCTRHRNPFYGRQLRLESVQNAEEQGAVAAAALCGKPADYDAIPWFWSDQYDSKLQIVGLASGYDDIVLRRESTDPDRLSAWYFRGGDLIAVDAVNSPKAYVIGGKFIRARIPINRGALADTDQPLRPATLKQ